MTISKELIRLTRGLSREAGALKFGAPVAFVYNPLEYARPPHEAYLERYAGSEKLAIFLGMNPGPFGMAQNGVPFGEMGLVRDWLKISGRVGKPALEHPKRPVEGFACARSEVSGARLWGAIAELYGTPGNFFAKFFVANYCPLVFMDAGGRNVTPDKLSDAERKKVFALCDEYLRQCMLLLKPRWVLGIGKFAEKRAQEALAGTRIRVTSVLHPSPAVRPPTRTGLGNSGKNSRRWILFRNGAYKQESRRNDPPAFSHLCCLFTCSCRFAWAP
jgi:single-strand selective monofunctional uracil DNA glycosylase